ncbi:MAG: response regulator [Candidatus Sumerlaeaceae bacterium]|nr:response regulator [Candidatus Sumerlaeaceae bacterium]
MVQITNTASVPRKILIFDTDTEAARSLAAELPATKCQVTLACDLGQAASMIRDGEFDAAIIEVEPPAYESVGLLRRLRAEHPSTKVVMLTDMGDDELWAWVLTEGASDLVQRPTARKSLEKLL